MANKRIIDRVPEGSLDKAIATIRNTGNSRQARELLKLSVDSYSKWKKRNPEIRARLDQAQKDYYVKGHATKTALAEDLSYKILCEGTEEVTTQEKVVVDPVSGDYEIKTLTKKIRRPAPLRLIERYLKVDAHEEYSLIKMLVISGYLPQAALTDYENALNEFRKSIQGIVGAEKHASQTERADISQSDLVDAATRAVQNIFTEQAPALPIEVSSRPSSDQGN